MPTQPITDSPLDKFQQFHKKVFTAPKDGFLAWGIAKMDTYEKEQLAGITYISGSIIERIIAAVMPLFALLDTICFLAKAFYKAVTMRSDEALADLLSCGKSLGIFFASVVATIPAICYPFKVYRTEEGWDKLMDQQMFQRIKNEYETSMENVSPEHGKGLEVLRQVIGKQCSNVITDSQIKEALQAILDNIKLPQEDQDNYKTNKKNILITNYMALFAHISAVIWKKDLTLASEEHNDFVKLATRLCDIHNDETRTKLFDILLCSLENTTFAHWQFLVHGQDARGKVHSLAEHEHLSFFAASQLNLKAESLNKLTVVCKNFFKDRTKNIELISFLADLYFAKVNITIKEDIISQIYEDQIKEEKIYLKAGRTRDAIKIYNTLLATNDSGLIQECLQIGKEKGSSDAVFQAMFNKIFNLELKAEELKVLLDKLRAPWAWLRFHTRLKELTGAERRKALEASCKCLKWAIEGTYQQNRHDDKHNPHLKAIFEKYPDLKESWIKAPVRKAADLAPNVHENFKELDVFDTQDPTDILLIGVEAHNCMNLYGLLNRVKTLIGFMMDGKTHVIVVKNAKKEIRAEVELQLMWDHKNKRPVLHLDKISAAASPDTVEFDNVHAALVAYAKERAQQLKIDLVGHYENDSLNYIYENPLAKPNTNYNGTVSSLGTSSPIEYVNCYSDTIDGPYSLKGANLLQKAYEEKRPEIVVKPNSSATSSPTPREVSSILETTEAWLDTAFLNAEGGLNRLPFLQAFLATNDSAEREKQVKQLAEHKKELYGLKAKKVQDAMAPFHFGFQQLCLQLCDENQASKQKRHLNNILSSLSKHEVPFSSPELIADCHALIALIDANKPTGEQIRQWLQQTWIELRHLDLTQWQLETLNKALTTTETLRIKPLFEEIKAARKNIQASLPKNSDAEIEEANLTDLQQCCMQLISEKQSQQHKKILTNLLALLNKIPSLTCYLEVVQRRLDYLA